MQAWLTMTVALYRGVFPHGVKVAETKVPAIKEFDSYEEQEDYIFDGYYEDVEQALADYAAEDDEFTNYDWFDVIHTDGRIDEDNYIPDDDGMSERDFL